ncbi:TPA: hypothetical protein I6209_002088 [Vibrio cholerae]|uniref:hypothetical protein n=5 Tax=Vibrio cholerae TaxID=666 RepID=UPI001159F645|nr:hypothetical protein [Vibrio cholerae]EJL6357670.1 hypothetical protein [Vibrio cholerae]KAA1228029.1 hypothetical protein F0Q18_00455 [Vibrio cholerae]MCD6670558.1 hypothetical protein [Vibrio cholerae]TQO66718.1 hypothetical protein FLM08_05630 [Vibrio cholerae]HAS3629567.1 hypothetical protein [Vibrio cholerae]
MRAIIFITFNLLVLIFILVYENKYLSTKDYYASIYVIENKNNVSHIKIASSSKNSKFNSLTYFKSPAISDVAIFNSQGDIRTGDVDGDYIIRYNMSENNSVSIVELDKAELYLRLKARTAFDHEETIKLLYSENDVYIFDMQRNNNIIMYSSNK